MMTKLTLLTMRVNPNLRTLLENHEAPGRARVIVLEGGTRSAKTWSIIEYLATLMLQHPNLTIGAYRADQATCRDSIIADFTNFVGLKNWNDAFRWRPSEFRHVCESTGSFVRYRGTREPQKLHGPAQDIAWINEAMEVSWASFVQIRNRTRHLIILDFNPSFTNHWLFDRVLNGADQEALKRGKVPSGVVYCHSTFKDNPFLPEDQTADIRSLEPTPEAIAAGTADLWHWQVYGLGQRGRVEGAVYPNVHSVPDSEWPLRNAFLVHGYAVDFGGAHNAVALEMGYCNNQVWIRELANSPNMLVVKSPSNPELPSLEQALRDGGCKPDDKVWCDSAGKQSIDQLRAAGFLALRADKGEILDGIRTLQGYRINVHEDSMVSFGQFNRYRFPPGSNGYLRPLPIKEDDDAPDAARYWAVEELGKGHPVLAPLKKRKARDAS